RRAPGPRARGRRRQCRARPRCRGTAERCPCDRGSRARRSRHGLSRRDRPRGASPVKWRLSARRAAKVSVGAVAGALACITVAIGGADGAALLGPRVQLPQAMAAAAVLALVITAVIRRVQFAPPSARAQRVSVWLAAATDLADLE